MGFDTKMKTRVREYPDRVIEASKEYARAVKDADSLKIDTTKSADSEKTKFELKLMELDLAFTRCLERCHFLTREIGEDSSLIDRMMGSYSSRNSPGYIELNGYLSLLNRQFAKVQEIANLCTTHKKNIAVARRAVSFMKGEWVDFTIMSNLAQTIRQR